MKYFIFSISLFFCTNIIGQDILEEVRSYPLERVTCYCKSEPDKIYSTKIYLYSKDSLLRQTIKYTLWPELDTLVVDYLYNNSGQLTSVKATNMSDSYVDHRTKVFKYNEQGNIIYSGFDDTITNNLIKKYSYANYSQLLQRVDSCNSNVFKHTFVYDNLGRLKKEYSNGVQLNLYRYNNKNQLKSILTYTPIRFYNKRLFMRLTHLRYKYENRAYLKTKYQYDNEGRLVERSIEGALLEKNTYMDGRLIIKETNEFGSDLCIYPCCGSYIYRYDYLE